MLYLEAGISVDAEGPVLLEPATHHLSMTIRMAQIDDRIMCLGFMTSDQSNPGGWPGG